MERKNAIIGDLLVNFYQGGNISQDNTLVFLHGWGMDALSFKDILNGRNNFVALDLPGFGKSDLPKYAWGMAEYADFLEKFLEKLEIKNPILIGHSFGAKMIIKYSSREREINPRKIILIDSAGVRKQSLKTLSFKVVAKIGRLFFILPFLKSFENKVKRKFHYQINAVDYLNAGEVKEIFKKVASEDLSEEMKKIKVPTILIWGRDDRITPLADGKRINHLISNSEMYIIDDAGHNVFLDQFEEFNKIFGGVISEK